MFVCLCFLVGFFAPFGVGLPTFREETTRHCDTHDPGVRVIALFPCIAGNEIGDEGAIAVAAALEVNTTATTLNLKGVLYVRFFIAHG